MPRKSKKRTHLNRTLLIALAAAVIVTGALSTFAKPGNGGKGGKQAQQQQDKKQKNDKKNKDKKQKQAKPGSKKVNTQYAQSWDAKGASAENCQGACFVAPDAQSMAGNTNYELTFRTSNLEAGAYRIRLDYFNHGATPPPGYKFRVIIKVNGKTVDRDRLPASTDIQKYVGKDLVMKNGENRVTIIWENDEVGAGVDANLAIRSISLKRQQNQPASYLKKAELGSYYAKEIQKSKNIKLGGGPAQSIREAAQGDCSPVPSANACVKLEWKMLWAMSEISKSTPFTVTSITTGDHTGCSNHYEGRGVDLVGYDGRSVPSRKVLDKFRKYGASELLGPGDPGHSDHLHAAWSGPHKHCE